MKYTKLIILLILHIVAYSCNSDDIDLDVQKYSETEYVRFSGTPTQSISKGIGIGDTQALINIDGAQFGAMMYFHDIGESFSTLSSTPDYAFNIPFVYLPLEGVWEHDDSKPAEWPKPYESLSFFTYYPYAPGSDGGYFPSKDHLGNSSLKIISNASKAGSPRLQYIAGDDVTYHQDVMLGNGSQLYDRTQPPYDAIPLPPVSFQFEHITSSIIFGRTASYESGTFLGDNFRFRITNIELSGIYDGGHFEMTRGAVGEDLKMKTPAVWDFISGGFTSDAHFELSAGDEFKKAVEPEDGKPETGQGKLEFIGTSRVSEVDIISYDNGIMFIPPQQIINNELAIIVGYELTRNTGSSTSPVWETSNDVVQYNISHTFEQGRRYRFDINYHYIGPVKGEINIKGVVMPWDDKEIDIPPYF